MDVSDRQQYFQSVLNIPNSHNVGNVIETKNESVPTSSKLTETVKTIWSYHYGRMALSTAAIFIACMAVLSVWTPDLFYEDKKREWSRIATGSFLVAILIVLSPKLFSLVKRNWK